MCWGTGERELVGICFYLNKNKKKLFDRQKPIKKRTSFNGQRLTSAWFSVHKKKKARKNKIKKKNKAFSIKVADAATEEHDRLYMRYII